MSTQEKKKSISSVPADLIRGLFEMISQNGIELDDITDAHSSGGRIWFTEGEKNYTVLIEEC